MAILGFPSTSIIDSTSAGRALLTAANAAAQRTLLGLGTSDSPTFTALVLSGQSLTGSSSTSVFDASTTWDTTGTPTAWKLNVTDTNSGGNPLLIDLQANGFSRFDVTAKIAATYIGQFSHNGLPRVRFSAQSSGAAIEIFSGSENSFIGFGTIGSTDVRLYRDSNTVLAQRNGVNSQIFRLYNTFTSSTNYERGKLAWEIDGADPVLRIGTEKGSGGGTARALQFQTDGTTRLTIASTGSVTVNNPVFAVSGDNPRIVLSDSDGTTRLAGIEFSTLGGMWSAFSNNDFWIGYTTLGTIPTSGSYLFLARISGAAAIGTNGVERFRIAGTGEVGIGTSSPSARLDIAGTADSVQLRVKAHTTQTNNIQEWWAASAALYTAAITPSCGFFTRAPTAFEVSNGRLFQLTADSNTFNIRDGSAGVTRVTVGSTGNVGIGTTSPSETLHVYKNGNASLKLEGTNISVLSFYGVEGGVGTIGTYADSSLRFGAGLNSATTHFVIASNGNIGLATASPEAKLDNRSSTILANRGGTYGLNIIRETNAPGSSGERVFSITTNAVGGSTWNTYKRQRQYEPPKILEFREGATGGFYFRVNSTLNSTDYTSDMSLVDALVIRSDTGNIGVGTTSPSSILHVSAGANAGLIVGTNNNQNIFQYLKGDGTNLIRGTWDGSNFHHYMNGNLYYNLNGFGFTFDGNSVGGPISISGNAWIALNSATTIAPGNANIWAGPNAYATVGNQLTSISPFAFSTWAWNGTNGVSITSRGYLKQTQQSAVTGDARLSIVRGADNVELFTVNYSNGNVGVGTTSPSERLHVENLSGVAAIKVNGSSDSYVEVNRSGIAGSRGILGTNYVGTFYNADFNIYANSIMHLSLRAGTGFLKFNTVNSGILAGDTSFSIKNSGNTATNVYIEDAGNIGIGNTAPSQKVHITGNLRVTGAYYDSTNSAGTSGQVLKSTATGTDWVDPYDLVGVNADYVKGVEGNRFVENLQTGVLYGGVITINALDNSKVDISAGVGVIVSPGASTTALPVPTVTTVTWTAKTAVTLTYLATSEVTWFSINSSGNVVQSPSAWSDSGYQTELPLGIAVHPNNTSISFAKPATHLSYGQSTLVDPFVRAFGPLKLSGNTISAYSTNLQISRSAGTSYSIGSNYVNDPNNPNIVSDTNANPISAVHYYFKNGSGGFNIQIGSLVDPTKYDNGSGTLQTASGGKYTIQRIFSCPTQPTLIGIYYGSQEYNSIEEAEANIPYEVFSESDLTSNQGVFCGYLIVKSNTTNLSVAADAKFIQAGLFRSVSTVTAGGQAITALDDLTDVVITSPVQGNFLRYNAANSSWVNGTGVDGTGTTNYVPKWSDSDTLANSLIFDNGTNVGIGTTSPSERFHIEGSSARILLDDTNQMVGDQETALLTLKHTVNNSEAPSGRFDDLFPHAGISFKRDWTTTESTLAKIQNYGEANWGGGLAIFTKDDDGSSSSSPLLTMDLTPDGHVLINRGNVGIGATTTSARLHVVGTGTSSSTLSLRIVNSTPTDLLRVADDGRMIFGPSSNTPRISAYSPNGGDGVTPNLTAQAHALLFYTDYTGPTAGNGTFTFNAASGSGFSHSVNNDISALVAFRGTVLNSNATTDSRYTSLSIATTINQTAGTSTVRGIWYSPTVTSATGVTHRAIETTRGDILFQNVSTPLFFVQESSGNVSVGTSSPSGRLHSRGSGAVAGAYALWIENSTPNQLLFIENNGIIHVGHDNQRSQIYPYSTSGGLGSLGTLALTGDLGIAVSSRRVSGGTTPGGVFLVTRENSSTATSGSDVLFVVGHKPTLGFAPTSGTTTFTAALIYPIINQTGGANGITRGVYVNPTLTAAADWRSIETSNNTGWAFYGAGTANSYFGGNVGIGNAAPSYALDISGTTPAIRVNNAAGNQRILVGSDGSGSFVGTFSNNDLRFFTNSAEVARITAAGNVGIGTTSTLARLHVKGSGNTSATFGINLEDSGGLHVFRVRDDGGIHVGPTVGATSGAFISASDGADNIGTTANSGLRYRSALGTAVAGADHFFRNYQGNRQYSSGIGSTIQVAAPFYPTSGTGVWAGIQIDSTINQTGGANGITRGLWINSNLIAVANWRSIETNNNTGWAFYGAGTANSYFGGNVGIGTTSPLARLHSTNAIIGRTYHSAPIYSFSTGILIATDIAVGDDEMVQLLIDGHSYDPSKGPTIARLQCYNYVTGGGTTIFQPVFTSTDPNLSIDVFHYNGFLYFWFAQTGSFQTYSFRLITALRPSAKTLTAITNAAKPTSGVTNSVTLTPIKLWTSGNDGAGSGLDADTLDGQQLSGIVSGTTNYVSKFTSATAIGNSQIFDNGTNVGIGTTSPGERFHLSVNSSSVYGLFESTLSGNSTVGIKLKTNYGGVPATSEIYFDYVGQGNIFKAGRDLSNSQGGFNFMSNSGTVQMVLRTNSGNVGIGTTSPLSRLNVSSSVNTVIEPVLGAATNSTAIFANSANAYGLNIVTSGSGVVFLQNQRFDTLTTTYPIIINGYGGNVGIGVTNPSQTLHVSGNVRVTGAYYDSNNSAGTSGQILASTGTGTDWVALSEITGVDGSGTLNYITKWTPDGNTIGNSQIFDNGTNVIIGGTSGSSAKFSVQADVQNVNYRSNIDLNNTIAAVAADVGSGIGFTGNYLTASTSQAHFALIGGYKENSTSGDYGGYFSIFTRPNGQMPAERFRITSSGNVAIGTTTPFAKLHVNGNIRIGSGNSDDDNSYSVTTGGQLVIHANDVSPQNNSYVGLLLKAGISSTTSQIEIYGSGSASYNHIAFSTSNSEKVRIDSNGNVGIGTLSPTVKLDIAGTVEVKDGVNPQTLNVYNTYSGAGANYERGKFGWSSNVLQIGTEKLGTGVARSLDLQTDAVTRLRIASDGYIFLGNGGSNNIRIYNQISGAGLLEADTNGIAFDCRVRSGVAATSAFWVYYGNDCTASSHSLGRFSGGFNPTSGNADHTNLLLNMTINQTGGANGITRGLWVNPTLTAAADWRSIQTSNNTGYAFYAAGTAPSYFGGRVGIGTVPSNALQVDVTVDASDGIYVRNQSTGVSAFSYVAAANNNSDQVAIRAYGSNNSIWPNTGFINSSSGFSNGLVFWQAGNAPFRFFTNSSERLRIDGAGNVGIGTISPSTLFEVSGANGSNIIRSTTTSNLGTTAWAGVTAHDIQFYNADPSGAGIYSAIRVIGGPNSGNPSGGTAEYDFTVWTGGYNKTLTERLRITSNGDVGIGVTAPLYPLDVRKTNQYSAMIHFNGGASPTDAGGYLWSYADDMATLSAGSVYDTSGNLTAKATTASDLYMYQGRVSFRSNTGLTVGASYTPTVRFTVAPDGSTGIGSSWAKGEKCYVAGGALILDNNQSIKFVDSADNNRRVILVSGANDCHFGPVDSGWGATTYLKAGGSIVFSVNQAVSSSNSVYFMNSGRVGIGTSGPQAKLQIVDTVESGSGSLAVGIVDLAQTWNTTGTPTAIKLNVTDTASNANSILMDLQVGGSSRFKVEKSGAAVVTSNLYLYGTGDADVNRTGISQWSSGARAGFVVGGVFRFITVAGYVMQRSDSAYSWSPDSNLQSQTPDLLLYRDAAGALAQRNGVNAQVFRVYNTYTDASNYERGKFAWSSNVLQIGTEKLGTGVARALEIQTDGTTRITVAATGAVTFAGAVNISSSTQMTYDGSSLSTTTATSITTFAAATYGSAEYLVQVRDTVTGQRQISKILIVHDGTTAYSTEYGVVFTGTAALATFTVDISGGNVRLLAAGATANSTEYKILKTTITV